MYKNNIVYIVRNEEQLKLLEKDISALLKNYDFKGNLWRQNLTEKGPIVGTHTYDDAFLLVKGHGLQEGTFSIVDMMPTIFDLMQIPLPEGLDGRSVIALLRIQILEGIEQPSVAEGGSAAW